MENKFSYEEQVEYLKKKYSVENKEFKMQRLITRTILIQPKVFDKKYICSLIAEVVPLTEDIISKIDDTLKMMTTAGTLKFDDEQKGYIVTLASQIYYHPDSSAYGENSKRH